jgi:quinol monooxygenase YgiN
VKLIFLPGKTTEFEKLFREESKTIATFDGCSRVELLKDSGADNVYFTLSHWRDEAALENYRQSAFFKKTWAHAKTFFAGKPEAWSLNQVLHNP